MRRITRRAFLAGIGAGVVGVGLASGPGRALGREPWQTPETDGEPFLRETDLATLSTLKAAAIDVASVSTHTVRVTLGTTNFASQEHDEARVSADATFDLFNVKAGANVVSGAPAGEVWIVANYDGLLRVRKDGDPSPIGSFTGPILVRTHDPSLRVDLRSITRTSYNQTYHPLYRGYLEIRVSSMAGKVRVVNVLDAARLGDSLEKYLYGVVPLEMPVDYGLEALKAQTVAARCYAAARSSGGVVAICDSTSCQVYFGFRAERTEGNQAVDATRGVVATHGGVPINAQYSACCGGHTEHNENVYTGGSPVAYLRGVRCHADRTPLDLRSEAAAAAFWQGWPASFCDWSTTLYRWARSWSRSDLEAIIDTHLSGANPSPAYNSGDLGELRDLQVLERGISGKIKKLRIVGRKGGVDRAWEVLGDYRVRFVLRTTKTAGIQSSSNMVFTLNRDSDGSLASVTAHGGGWGHGVGLCQRGARGMASAGYAYADILAHYYSGIVLQGGNLPPPAPLPVSPGNGALILSSATVILTWSGAASAYEAQLRNTAGTVIRTRPWSAETTWATARLPAGVYEWRVRGRNDVGEGSYCAWQRLVSADVIHRLRLPVVPNNGTLGP